MTGCVWQIHTETEASVTTKGVWYPDKSKATEKDPPLYLHISAATQEILNKAIEKVNELINTEMGSLLEDRKRDDRGRERVRSCPITTIASSFLHVRILQKKWPEEKIPVGLETLRNFNVRAKVVGPTVRVSKLFEISVGSRLLDLVVGYVRKIHSAGNRHSCPNQGPRLWVSRQRDWS